MDDSEEIEVWGLSAMMGEWDYRLEPLTVSRAEFCMLSTFLTSLVFSSLDNSIQSDERLHRVWADE